MGESARLELIQLLFLVPSFSLSFGLPVPDPAFCSTLSCCYRYSMSSQFLIPYCFTYNVFDTFHRLHPFLEFPIFRPLGRLSSPVCDCVTARGKSLLPPVPGLGCVGLLLDGLFRQRPCLRSHTDVSVAVASHVHTKATDGSGGYRFSEGATRFSLAERGGHLNPGRNRLVQDGAAASEPALWSFPVRRTLPVIVWVLPRNRTNRT